ncbi:hypothetical protein BJ508DRAFT_310821 [Ascobolus immersus RN42]|uniref:SMODS and SLOG-associating 2TM effector domain-containing protein n=1 Tax=Ascobolus immersus RN42 TaxID=1160509 RepID=A0A3N4HVZ1_ASCIM|nr:hypothetical protein BJ508DRAFT_310821 [Ascobolus immersus RN42]
MTDPRPRPSLELDNLGREPSHHSSRVDEEAPVSPEQQVANLYELRRNKLRRFYNLWGPVVACLFLGLQFLGLYGWNTFGIYANVLGSLASFVELGSRVYKGVRSYPNELDIMLAIANLNASRAADAEVNREIRAQNARLLAFSEMLVEESFDDPAVVEKFRDEVFKKDFSEAKAPTSQAGRSDERTRGN